MTNINWTASRKRRQAEEGKEKMKGTYYGVARKTSPWAILATFSSQEEAEEWIGRQAHPEQFRVVEY